MGESAFDAAVRSILHTVFDPCSIAARAPTSVIDLGLIQSWDRVAQDTLVVHMGVTTAGCTMVGNIMQAIETSLLEAFPELSRVEVELHPEIFWTPDSMTQRGRAQLADRRRQRLELVGVRPHQWREVGAPGADLAAGG